MSTQPLNRICLHKGTTTYSVTAFESFIKEQRVFMDSDPSFFALGTDTRPTPLPPPSPPASPPSPPSATPLSVNEVESSAQAGQTILNPVPPSKRAAQIAIESYTQTAEDYSRQISAYLPQDICQIIKLRQRRERA
ncbi:hypothetical protein K3495_g14929 [Podosphaera aphanis]|nr:hypothetical protein K3495_g14929 [Podosphaera aphanis]